MDPGDLTQLILVATTALVVGRLGWSLARLIDRRASRPQETSEPTADRLRALEDEQVALRQELAELQERQDFTERVLLRGPSATPDAADPVPQRIATPR